MQKLVQKFLENRCTPEEAEVVLEWLKTKDGQAFLRWKISHDKETFFHSKKTEFYPELDSVLLLDQIKEKRGLTGKSHSDGKNKNSRNSYQNKSRQNRKNFLPFVMAAVFIAVAVMIFNPFYAGLEEPPVSYQFFETDRGERKTVYLRDGSTLVLNHESRINIPDDFSATNRRVSMEGQVWFEVESDDEHPFHIEAYNSVVRVLGTSFVMESYPKEKSTRVVVSDGKVAIGAINTGTFEEKIITKNQGGLLITGQEIEIEEIRDIERYTGWRNGKLIFYDTPFGEVVERLERWYDVECIVTDPAIKKEKFTSVFEDEPLRQVLDVIAISMNIRYEIDNQMITFKSNNL